MVSLIVGEKYDHIGLLGDLSMSYNAQQNERAKEVTRGDCESEGR